MTAENGKRVKVAVLFGGRSSEHEISILSALEMVSAMDTTRFEPIPVYITTEGKWFSGEELLDRAFYKNLTLGLAKLTEVSLPPHPGSRGLLVLAESWSGGFEVGERIPVDVYFPVFHGQFGEDGCIQGLFELAEVPYVGCGVMSAAVAMNKYVCKKYLAAHGIPVLPATTASKGAALRDFQGVVDSVLQQPGMDKFPLFIKPCNMGSSVGIGKANNRDELAICLSRVFRYDHRAIIEPCVADLFEINVSVMGETAPVASVVEIPVSTSGILTYEDKYMRGGKKGGRPSQGMASLLRSIDPPDLAQHYKDEVRAFAERAYGLLECAGVARLDFIVDKKNGKLYFNEINSPPGSLAHYLWAKSKPRRLYTENIQVLIEEALEIYARKISLQREIGFKALFS